MPSDLIYREDAKDYARHAIAKGLNVLESLDEVPAADFRPVVRGKWERYYSSPRSFAKFYMVCSACEGIVPDCYWDNNFKYCPNCGAEMEETKDV